MGCMIGYTQGVFDMFHKGHLNMLKNAKAQCDKLIVGVNSDSLVEQYKGVRPVINQNDRLDIVRAIKYVDEAYIIDTLDKRQVYMKYRFDLVFIGDDWKGSSRWLKTEEEMRVVGVYVIYLPYTDGVSTTLLRNKLNV